MQNIKIFFSASTLILALTAQAEIYRWTDDSGKVHYSDTAPGKDVNHAEISSQLTPNNIDEGNIERKKLSKIFAPKTEEEKQIEQQNRLAKQQQAEQLEQRCDKAQDYYHIITTKRFVMIDEDGNEYDISREEAAAKQEKAKRFLQENC